VIEEGKSAKDAALMTDINIRTAQHYIKKYNDEEEKCLPVDASKKFSAGRTGKLTDEHSKFLVEALHRHGVQKCKVTLKKLEKLPPARISDRVVNLLKEKVEEWEATPDLDFCRDCVFIDEADFNLHTQRNYGRSRKGSPAKGVIPTARGLTITILGAHIRGRSHRYIIEETQAAATSKKRKGEWEGSSCRERSNRNPDRALFGVPIECNGCSRQKQHE
jgi:hypothetical protein